MGLHGLGRWGRPFQWLLFTEAIEEFVEFDREAEVRAAVGLVTVEVAIADIAKHVTR